MQKSLFFGLLFLVLILVGCDSGQQIKAPNNLASTNLSNVSIDNIKIGSTVGDVDLSGYTLSSRYEERENTYHFEELRITTDETGAIVYIQGNIQGQNKISLSVNQADEFETIEDATAILGKEYHSYWYDREQSLKANTYTDKDNNVNLTFVYDNNSQDIVWAILSK